MSETASKTVHIRYFALLKEERGLPSEVVETKAANLAQLYNELRGLHELSLPLERMSVAVNDAFVEWNQQFETDDVIVFVPPVAGG